MTAIINAIDNNYTSIQLGEKCHKEYTWSNNMREQILQFNFQLTRTKSDDETNRLANKYKELIEYFTNELYIAETIDIKNECIAYLGLLYKMIGHTRDIIDGKGEYTLAYMMIFTWYDINPNLAFFALKCLVDLDNSSAHPYGSWKDIKYFATYCRSRGCSEIYHPLIRKCVEIMNEQIRKDEELISSGLSRISLAAKWVPREKSGKFGWLFKLLACDYFNKYIETAKDFSKGIKAILKCKTEYRKLISKLNRILDTLQIKQCDNNWSEIDFKNVTSISLLKQTNAFLNIKKNGEEKKSNNIDRSICTLNFINFIEKGKKDEYLIKGKRITLDNFTKKAIELLKLSKYSDRTSEIDLLNLQWKNNSDQNVGLGKMIAMVDVSSTMDGNPMNAAIGLGLRIAEKSLLGKRIMTFSSKPSWINLENDVNFVDMIKKILHAEYGANTNFYAAMKMILDSIIESNLAPEDVQDMVLVILSDMQIDDAYKNSHTLYDNIKKLYEDAGLRLHGRAFKPPHILFWNLRKTDGFPTLSTQENTSMMSGYSPLLLNLFCEKGSSSLESCTPWSILIKMLNNERYKKLGEMAEIILT